MVAEDLKLQIRDLGMVFTRRRGGTVTAVERLLTEPPHFVPDAHPSASLRMHLEMDYEEHVWGGYSD